MRKFLLVSSVLVAMTTAAVAQSTNERVAPQSSELSFNDIAASLSRTGMKVIKLEQEHGHYEAEGIDATGAYVKVKVDPRTGSILSRKVKN